MCNWLLRKLWRIYIFNFLSDCGCIYLGLFFNNMRNIIVLLAWLRIITHKTLVNKCCFNNTQLFYNFSIARNSLLFNCTKFLSNHALKVWCICRNLRSSQFESWAQVCFARSGIDVMGVHFWTSCRLRYLGLLILQNNVWALGRYASRTRRRVSLSTDARLRKISNSFIGVAARVIATLSVCLPSSSYGFQKFAFAVFRILCRCRDEWLRDARRRFASVMSYGIPVLVFTRLNFLRSLRGDRRRDCSQW